MSEHTVARVAFVPETKTIDRDSRSVRHIITTNSIDRAGDVVEPKGVDLRNYKTNPVVLVDHDHSVNSIIGTARDIKVTDQNIEVTTEFGNAGLGPQAFDLVAARMARAWSIGFLGKSFHDVREGARSKCKHCIARLDNARDEAVRGGRDPETDGVWVRGLHFMEWELLEYSLVAIPMNQDVISNSVVRNLDDVALGKLFAMPTNDKVNYIRSLISCASESGNTPHREEEKEIKPSEIYSALLGWGNRLKKQIKAEELRKASEVFKP